MLIENRPASFPAICDAVFAVIDTASKTGTDNDATAVTFFAIDKHFGGAPLWLIPYRPEPRRPPAPATDPGNAPFNRSANPLEKVCFDDRRLELLNRK